MKFVLRAEGERDYADLLLSFQHFPNLISSDLSPIIARHTNIRWPEKRTFTPNNGCFAEETKKNIAAAKSDTLVVNLAWLNKKNNPPDEGGHPITGSAEHCALDTLHEKNWKADIHKLRSLRLVPQLAGIFNSDCGAVTC